MGVEYSLKPPMNCEIKPPTCEKYEGRFLKIFETAISGNIFPDGNIYHNGIIIAKVFEDQRLFGVKKGIKGARSNAGNGFIIVKNPHKVTDEYLDIGERNGLIVLHNVACAVRIVSQSLYITRAVVPEHQEIFVSEYNRIIHAFQNLQV